MSRIHEALKRAEEQRPPSWKPAEPAPLRFGGERLAPGVLQPSLQREMPTARRCLELEVLRRRCLKPGGKLNPDYDVSSTKQSSALCSEVFRTLPSPLYRF